MTCNTKHGETPSTRLVTRIDGQLYDLSEWATIHPGGASTIEAMSGIDGTQLMLYAHTQDDHVWKMLRAYKVKDHEILEKHKNTIPKNHPEYTLLLQREREGIKTGKSFCSWRYILLNHAAMILALVFGTYAAAFLGDFWIGATMIGWAQYHAMGSTMHMAHHHSLLSTGARNRLYLRWFSLLISGYDSRTYFYTHAEHHAFTNNVDKDSGLKTGVVVWHPNQLFENHPDLLLRFQALLWWPQGTLLACGLHIATLSNLFPFLANSGYIDIRDIRMQIAPSKFGAIIFIARNVLFSYYFGLSLFVASTSIQSFWGVMNGGSAHWDCEKHTNEEASQMSPIERVCRSTKNWANKSAIFDFVTSYSTVYHLTHHAYPTLAPEYGAEGTKTLRDDCVTFGIEYPKEQTMVEGLLGPVKAAYRNYSVLQQSNSREKNRKHHDC